MMRNNILVLGVGNTLRRDDGIGPKIIKVLRSRSAKLCLSADCEFIDGGTDGLALIDIIGKYQRVIIIDAVDVGDAPATIRVFTPEQAIINIKSATLSTHGFGLAEVIKLLPELEISTKLIIIGIQPKNISFGEGLSAEIASKINAIIDLVQQQINNLVPGLPIV